MKIAMSITHIEIVNTADNWMPEITEFNIVQKLYKVHKNLLKLSILYCPALKLKVSKTCP